MATTEELMQEYIAELISLHVKAGEADMDDQEYLNEHPEALPIVGDGDQTLTLWTKDSEAEGSVFFFAEGHKWEVTKLTYDGAKELLEKHFPGETLSFKWAPYWAYAAEQFLAQMIGCGCDEEGCGCDDEGCGCGHHGCDEEEG